MVDIHIATPEEQKLREDLASRHDSDGERLKRFLALRDLSRAADSPLAELITRVKQIPRFSSFDTIEVPEIVRANLSFDLFNFPSDHPARSKSDTYFVNNEYILRTHTTIMWYYYFREEVVEDKIAKHLPLAVLSYGKVYRKDEIDRHHLNVFHQMDGLYLAPKSEKVVVLDDLKEVLVEIAQTIFGKDMKYRFNPDTFPYTDPSIEMEVDKEGSWVEVLGGGIVQSGVLKKLGVDPEQYTGWAFGFGLERLAIISMELPDIRLLWSEDPRVTKQLHLGTKFVSVSKYPPITRDISFVVGKEFVLNDYFDLIRDIGGDLIEEVAVLDKYENPEKFGPDKTSYTFRVVYRSNDRTLTTEEIDPLQKKLYEETALQFNAKVR